MTDNQMLIQQYESPAIWWMLGIMCIIFTVIIWKHIIESYMHERNNNRQDSKSERYE